MNKTLYIAATVGVLTLGGGSAVLAKSVNAYLNSSQVSEFCTNVATSSSTSVSVTLDNGTVLKGELECESHGGGTSAAVTGPKGTSGSYTDDSSDDANDDMYDDSSDDEDHMSGSSSSDDHMDETDHEDDHKSDHDSDHENDD